MLTPILKSEYLDVLDKAQAFEIFEDGDLHEHDVYDLNKRLKELQRNYYLNNEIDVSRSIESVNCWLNQKFEMSSIDTRKEVGKFISERHPTNNVDSSIEEINSKLHTILDENYNISDVLTTISSKFDELELKSTRTKKASKQKEKVNFDVSLIQPEILDDISKVRGWDSKIIYLLTNCPTIPELSTHDCYQIFGKSFRKNTLSELKCIGKLKSRTYYPPHTKGVELYSLAD